MNINKNLFFISFLIFIEKIKLKKLSFRNNIRIGYFYFLKRKSIKNLKKSLFYFENALKIKPDSRGVLFNLTITARFLKDYNLEKKYWDTFIQLGYCNSEYLRVMYSEFLILSCNIKEWHKCYQSRVNIKNYLVSYYSKIKTPFLRGGEDLSDKTLFIHYEQGLGDNILMFGYMPRLVKLAKHVIFYVENPLYNLLKNNDFGVEIICPKIKNIKYISCNYHTLAMSIPQILNVNIDNISVNGNYLKADKQLIEDYNKKYFNNNKFKIGIAFKGAQNQYNKNIPLKELIPLTKLKNVQLYCFTLNLTEKEIKLLKKHNIINISRSFKDFTDTAAAIMNTDIVVSSDNVILNLAGALGKRTIGLFNYQYSPRWYNLSGEDSGWFKCVKPIVNEDWDSWKKSVKLAIKEIKEIM